MSRTKRLDWLGAALLLAVFLGGAGPASADETMNLEATYQAARNFEGSAYPADKKRDVWQSFLDHYPNANPHAEEARERVRYWNAQVGGAPPPSPPPNPTSKPDPTPPPTAVPPTAAPPTAVPPTAAPPTPRQEPPAATPEEPRPRVRTKRLPLPGGEELEMVWVSAGEYQMGCSEGDAECEEEDWPRAQVEVDGFWMSRTEVTQAQWEAVAGTRPWLDGEGCVRHENHALGAAQPAYCVSWEAARAFARNVGQGLRLPTEAEWEWAARGGELGARYGELGQIAWYRDNSGQASHEVGQKKPNAHGLYDMLGNVWEWCQDGSAPPRRREEHEGRGRRVGVGGGPEGPRKKRGKDRPEAEGFRLLRGGSWFNQPGNVRVSFRGRLAPESSDDRLGFRLVQSRP